MLKRVSQVVGKWANPCNRQTYGGVLVQSIPGREMRHLGWTPLWRCVLVTTGTRPPQGPVSAAITDGSVLASRRSSRACTCVLSCPRAALAPPLGLPSTLVSQDHSPGDRCMEDEALFPAPFMAGPNRSGGAVSRALQAGRAQGTAGNPGPSLCALGDSGG